MIIREFKEKKSIFGLASVFLAILVLLISCGPKPEPADWLVTEARVYTVNPAQPWAEAVAIKGDKIVFVGSAREARKFAGKQTKIIEAKGKLLLPGIQDSHVHFLSGSLNLTRVDLSGTRSVEEIQDRIRRFSVAHPALNWVQGRGWMYSAFPDNMPHKRYLDEVVPDRPAVMRCADGHTSWVNSKALALAGITKKTPDPVDGKIVRDSQGEPTGALLEGASSLVSRLIPEPTKEEKLAALRAGMKEAARWGVSCAHGLGGEFEELELFEQINQEGSQTLRLVVAMWIDEPGPKEKDFEAYARTSAKHHDNWLAVRGVKLMLDGVIDSGTGAMLQPYEDQGDNRGKLFWEPEDYKKAVLEFSRRGIQVSTHSIGDRAIRLTLEAYELAARESGHPELRHKIEHAECIAADDIKRFGQPFIVASFQPLHANPEPAWMSAWIKNAGPEREQRAFAWNSVLKAGGRLAFGSDWPVVTINPWPGVQMAVTREDWEGKPQGGWLPGERITLEQAIYAYTLGGAYALNEEGIRGSIEPGKLADLVLLSQNIFEIPVNKIRETTSVLTMVGGKIMSEARTGAQEN